MTRKDYVLIAEAIRRENDAPGYAEKNRGVVYAIAAALASENPRFDRARFLKACGLEI